MAYTPLGYSLPDLTVTGYAAPAASWGGSLDVTVTVRNMGASTIPEPFAQQPGATTSADAPATTVAVFASPQRNSLRNEVLLGFISIPATQQNSFQQVSQTLTLPDRPRGFSGDGGAIFLHYVVNPNRSFPEMTFSNNNSVGFTRVQIAAPLPQLEAVALDVPPVMQPGDTINPTIQVANVGTADTNVQGTVTVALVASVDRSFGPGSSIVALYQVPNIQAVSKVSSQSSSLANTANINTPNNIVTIFGNPVTLPVRPSTYFLGVVVDPFNQIKQLGKIGRTRASSNNFSLIQQVGPPITNLPPAGVVTPGGVSNNSGFPFPVSRSTVGFGNLSGS